MWLTKRRSYHQIQTGKYIEIYCPTNGRKTEVESEKKRIIWFFEEKHGIAETLTFYPLKCSRIAHLSSFLELSLIILSATDYSCIDFTLPVICMLWHLCSWHISLTFLYYLTDIFIVPHGGTDHRTQVNWSCHRGRQLVSPGWNDEDVPTKIW